MSNVLTPRILRTKRAATPIWAALALAVALHGPVRAQEGFDLPARPAGLLDRHCFACHDGDAKKGDVRLDNLSALNLGDRLALLNRIQEQLYIREMPPRKRKAQPTGDEREILLNWVGLELRKHNASKLEAKLRKPEFGNYVDHDKLFSGEYTHLKGFTHDRRWLISEYIFDAKFNRILQFTFRARQGRKTTVTAFGGTKRSRLSLTNPFLLPERSGVRDYADTTLDGGHLSAMITNAQKAAEYITGYLVKRNKKFLPAINEIMALEDRHTATLAARRDFLETHIARLCEDLYGSRNESLLPDFVPVKLKERKALEKGEKYKKAPVHVAQNMIKNLGGAEAFYWPVMTYRKTAKTDEALFEACEREWFYYGTHERKIQGRVTILRDYLKEIRDYLDGKNKIKPRVYKPLADSEMEILRKAITKHRQKGDFYMEIVDRCLAAWEKDFARERAEAGPPPDALLARLIDQLFVLILEREPSPAEQDKYLALSHAYVSKQGALKAIQKLIQTLILSTEFVYRREFGAGKADVFGRRMLSPRDASYAIAYALTDQSPDEELAKAAAEGRLKTREDFRREVTRILKQRDKFYIIDKILAEGNHPDNVTNTPIRKLRFFREFFGYPKAQKIFKDEKRFGGGRLKQATQRLLNETDRLVDHILKRDRNVFEELLTTDAFYVYHSGDNERMQAASDRIKSIYAHFKDTDWKNFKKEDLLNHREFLKQVKMRSVDPDKLDARNRQGNTLQLFKKSMTTITARLDKGQKEAAPFDLYQGYGTDFMNGANVARFFNYRLDNWDYKTVQPAAVPHRRGLLTHPAWLIAHADNTQTNPVIRGKWIREKLLAGSIPDVPITVDAVIPEDHGRTLRDRLASATEVKYCWKCHVRMNPLGYPFESYDDFGRFRTEEALEYPDALVKKGPEKPTHLTDSRDTYKTLPVNARGVLEGTGDPALDGEVRDAMDLGERLGKSDRVRQSIIRHAFRYFMGRNEVLSDSKTLIDADQAYLKSGGSFDAVIVSLLTSDSFIYRKSLQE